MTKTLLGKAAPIALALFSNPAHATVPKAGQPSISPAVEAVVCVGDRRNYRNFNHCWRVNSRRVRVSRAANYCSRICDPGRRRD
jgi:hypothetical protein